MLRPSALALSALLLAGCTIGPDYAAPRAPGSPAYATPSPGKTAVTPDTAWWKAFNDPQLDRLERSRSLDLRDDPPKSGSEIPNLRPEQGHIFKGDG